LLGQHLAFLDLESLVCGLGWRELDLLRGLTPLAVGTQLCILCVLVGDINLLDPRLLQIVLGVHYRLGLGGGHVEGVPRVLVGPLGGVGHPLQLLLHRVSVVAEIVGHVGICDGLVLRELVFFQVGARLGELLRIVLTQVPLLGLDPLAVEADGSPHDLVDLLLGQLLVVLVPPQGAGPALALGLRLLLARSIPNEAVVVDIDVGGSVDVEDGPGVASVLVIILGHGHELVHDLVVDLEEALGVMVEHDHWLSVMLREVLIHHLVPGLVLIHILLPVGTVGHILQRDLAVERGPLVVPKLPCVVVPQHLITAALPVLEGLLHRLVRNVPVLIKVCK